MEFAALGCLLANLLALFLSLEEVDDLSNSDQVKSTVTSSETQMGTPGILLIAISPTSIFASFDNILQCIPKEPVAACFLLCRSGCLGENTTSYAGFSGLAFNLRIYYKTNFFPRIFNGGA